MGIFNHFRRKPKKEREFPIPDDLLEKLEEFKKMSEGSSEEVNALLEKMTEATNDVQDFPKALNYAVSRMSSRWFATEIPWALNKLAMKELLALLATFEYHIFLGRLAERVLEEEEK